jgi:hypothetical protein
MLSLQPSPDDLVLNCDKIPTRSGLDWIYSHPPRTFYKLRGLYFMYTFRWFFPNITWPRASILRWEASISFQQVRKSKGEVTPVVSLIHCSYCFSNIGSFIRKFKSFCHHEYAFEPFINPSFILAAVTCGKALIPSQQNAMVPFPENRARDLMPGSHPELDYLTRTIGFSDVHLATTQNPTRFLKYFNCTKEEAVP